MAEFEGVKAPLGGQPIYKDECVLTFDNTVCSAFLCVDAAIYPFPLSTDMIGKRRWPFRLHEDFPWLWKDSR
jgi:hypothetical protein